MATDLHSITRPRGFVAGGTTCGIKPSGAPDLAIIASDRPAKLTAMFTRNAVVGAPVIVGRAHAAGRRGRAFVCNSGVANVATGNKGIEDALNMCAATGEALGCDPRHVLPFSTGVIGHRLPIGKVLKGITALSHQLARGKLADTDAARAIMTTDLVPKAASRKVAMGNSKFHLGGIAKGSGMIAPNMATMLVFLTTDANIGIALLRRALRDAVNADASFNRITVDSDTSTSDTIAIMANGAADHTPIRTAGVAYKRFAAALADLCGDLAYQVINDGEGAEHVIHVTVSGAASDADAQRAARAVADSPLVKTAVHGCDPNWGRIAMAVGKSGAKAQPDRMSITIAGTRVFTTGKPRAFDEKQLSRTMRAHDVAIDIALGLGKGRCKVLGCDLSRKYIDINADYTT